MVISSTLYLREIGQQIDRDGYSFETLHEGLNFYFHFILGDDINFGPEHIEFTDSQTIDLLVQEHLEREFQRTFSLLPATDREKYTLDDLKLIASNTGVGAIIERFVEMRGIKVGHYSSYKDKCYIAKSCYLWQDLQRDITKTVAHELGHRYVHHKRKRTTALQGKEWLYNANQEEQFCRRLEDSFASYLFSSDLRVHSPENWNASRKLASPLLRAVTNPRIIEAFTKSQMEFYRVCLPRIDEYRAAGLS